jgi:hypothetical protein
MTGSSEFDALARLGIAAQTLSKPADTKTKTSSTTTDTTSYALGLPSNLDISTSTGASLARAGLLSVLGAIQKIYTTTNTTATSTTTATTSSASKASAASLAYLSNQNADSSLALSIMSA